MPGTFSQVLLHFVFATKDRRPLVQEKIAARLYPFIGGIVRDEKGSLHAIGGMPDHIHLLIQWRTDDAVANLLRNIKSRSTAWMHRTLPDMATFAWQEGYSVFSVSKSAEPDVKNYVERQADHHKQRDFKEELLTPLRLHGIDFEEKYVFD